ncbi:MAG: hypothetical protein FWD72_01935 [Eggerthellaceae bacterium]|nr:hypothetical protein [Eggerthellaceae bacterium]
MTTYEERSQRISDSIALKEPAAVPHVCILQCYPIYHAGYTMADVLYDADKGVESFVKFAKEYQPDGIFGHEWVNVGMGPILELMQPLSCLWAGAPDGRLDKNSIHQFLEYEVLHEEDMGRFQRDYTGWVLEQGLPKVAGVTKPFTNMGLSRMGTMYDVSALAASFSKPEVRNMVETLWKIDEMKQALNVKMAQLDAAMEAEGCVVPAKGFAAVPFDSYSDFYRGTLEAMVDMTQHTDVIDGFRETELQNMLGMVRMQGQFLKGKWVFMALHKGMDTYMSPEQYRKFYWDDLRTIIEEIIANDMVPFIYTEGPYDSRLEALTEVTKGKVIYHFENVNMKNAKKILGDTACIHGGLQSQLLQFGSKQQVIDECKRIIDDCAPGGGFLFGTNFGFDDVKPENVEAMFDTVATYGKK